MVLAEDLLTALHKSPLPFALIDVDKKVIVDANGPARRLIGIDSDVDATPLRDVVLPENLETVFEILSLVDAGALDAYQSKREFHTADGSLVQGEMWVQSIRELMPHAALAVFTPDAETPALMIDIEDDGAHLAHNAPVVVGALDVELRIIRVSADTHELFGRRAESLHGMAFVDVVHPDDVASFLMAAGRVLSGSAGFGQRLRVRSGNGDEWVSVRMHLAPLKGGTTTQLGFVLAAAPPDIDLADRSAELEQRLWRIALEVQAAGVLDALHDVPSVPSVHDLSSRQWEVLARCSAASASGDCARDVREPEHGAEPPRGDLPQDRRQLAGRPARAAPREPLVVLAPLDAKRQTAPSAASIGTTSTGQFACRVTSAVTLPRATNLMPFRLCDAITMSAAGRCSAMRTSVPATASRCSRIVPSEGMPGASAIGHVELLGLLGALDVEQDDQPFGAELRAEGAGPGSAASAIRRADSPESAATITHASAGETSTWGPTSSTGRSAARTTASAVLPSTAKPSRP